MGCNDQLCVCIYVCITELPQHIFFSLRFVLVYDFFVTIKNMITLKPRKQTIAITPIVYKNISYGNLVFTEQLFEVGG